MAAWSKSLRICAAIVSLSAASVLLAEKCWSFRDSRGRSSVDFAPLHGYTEICSQDFQLCVMLTQGYPPSVQTIGYFVLDDEWQRYKQKKQKGFSRYLIAQRCRTLSSEEFADFKRYIRSNQGNVMDHTESTRVFELKGRVPLGVIDEKDDSISFGTILKTTRADQADSQLIASIDVALQLKGESLSLYVFDVVKDLKDTERIKALSNEWLRCIKDRNK